MSRPSRQLVLIGNFAPDRQESMLRFAQVLEDGFSARGWRVENWRPVPRFARLAGTYRYGGMPKYLGYLDKFIVFPRRIRRMRARRDPSIAYHIVDQGNAVYASALAGTALTVTCHDLLQVRSALGEFPQNPVSKTGQRYQQWILSHLRKLDRVVCISGKTRADLQRLTGLDDSATPIVYMGLNFPYYPVERSAAEHLFSTVLERQHPNTSLRSILERSFLIGIGGAHWYKNRTGLVNIFVELQRFSSAPQILVYVGPPWDAEQEEILARHNLQDRIVRLTGVSNEQLRAAYRLARGLLFPSWEEGFGWPIAEAQACGCPVFTTDRPPMTEIGGDAACYFDPKDPVGAARRIADALKDVEPMRERGLLQSKRWDAKQMLDGYEAEYQRGSFSG